MCEVRRLVGSGVYEESVSWICPTPAPPGECLDHEDFPPQYIEYELPSFKGMNWKTFFDNLALGF